MKRDHSLDAIKGVGCILMIFAHAKVNLSSSIILKNFSLIGTFAPVLFFAVSGITATLQSKKSSFSAIVVFYTMFAVLGLSYNAIWQPLLWQNLLCDIPQIIAVCVVTIILIEKYFQPKKYYYILFSVAIFALQYFLNTNPILSQLNFHRFLISSFSFALIPWILMFFTGVFAYYINNQINLAMGVIYLVILSGMILGQQDLYVEQKYNMSASYYLISQMVIFFCIYVFRSKKDLFKNPNNIVLYFGKNSLLFLYIHLIILKIFQVINFRYALPVWLSTLTLTYILMKLSQFTNKYIEKYFHSIFIWLTMIVCVCLVPLSQKLAVILPVEMLIGVVFANNYQSLSNIIKHKFSNPSSA